MTLVNLVAKRGKTRGTYGGVRKGAVEDRETGASTDSEGLAIDW